jgi:HEAT repeat protein
VAFDDFSRRRLSGWHPGIESWHRIEVGKISQVAGSGEAAVSILGIASLHGNGYVREQALRLLAAITTGAELPFLLLRLNDWVAPLRKLALAFVQNRLHAGYAVHWLRYLPLVLRLKATTRADHSVLLSDVAALFRKPESFTALEDGLSSADPLLRRFSFDVILSPDHFGFHDALLLAFRQSDPHVRFRAAARLSEALPADQYGEILHLALRDSYMPVRRLALCAVAAKLPERAHAEFLSALLDQNLAIRQLAQSHFRGKNEFDLRDWYQQKLSVTKNRALAAAIAGLGETGSAKDAIIVAPFLSAELPKIRAAAIRSLARSNPDPYLNELVFALSDPSARVSREAVLALAKSANRIGPERLSEVFHVCSSPISKCGVLRLIARLNKWDSIALLLQSLAESHPFVAEMAKRHLVRWFARFNRSFPVPSPEQLARLQAALVASQSSLNPAQFRELHSLLKTNAHTS